MCMMRSFILCGSLLAGGATPAAILGDPTPPGGIQLERLGTYETGIFDGSAAEIPAYDPASQRLFVVNADQERIDVLDMTNPTQPTFAFFIDTLPYGAPNSVAIMNGIVAVAIEAPNKTDPGKIGFYDAMGVELNALTAGALPDMVTFTPDGTKVIVANEGEPNANFSVDPEGSVSIVDISSGVESLTDADVVTAGFTQFNDQLDELLDAGVRIFGPGATVAQDLEPEYIAVNADSTIAHISLQEANALAVLDINAGIITDILPLGYKNHALGEPLLDLHIFADMPPLGTTDAGQQIALGGFSGLYFDGMVGDTLKFIAHPDRGPNADTIDTNGDGVNERPFPLPDFQPRLVFFDLNMTTGELTITDQLMLTREDGTALTGLANMFNGNAGFAHNDEVPIDLFGNPLPYDPLGGDLEGVVRAEDGTFWMCDEYRPALYHFDADGRLINRFVPEGSNDFGINTGIEAFPAVYAQRRANRGFEGLAYQHGRIYAFIQSPLDNPDVANDQSSKDSVHGRILEFDIATQTTIGEYLYVFDGGSSDKIGDAVSIRNGEFLVIERDSAIGPDSIKNVYHVDIADATNLLDLDPAIVGPGGSLELMTPEELDTNGIVAVDKSLYVDLAAAGYSEFDKPEGLAMIHPGLLAVVNDNDFQVQGAFDIKTGLLAPNPNPQPTALGLLRFAGNGLDASDEDGTINITNWPVFGMYLPDGIDAYTVDGATYIATANEGDARDYSTFSEEDRIKDVELDPIAFPTADFLQQDENLGRLTITNVFGRVNDDPDAPFETLYAFGGRSFSIWSETGDLVFDSGDQFEQITAAIDPSNFNSNNDENDSFESRSDNKGPEPEDVKIAEIEGRMYAFIGLERVGGVMVYDVTDPASPFFVLHTNNRDFDGDAEEGTADDLGAEGLLVIPAEESPTGSPLLVVANEVSGSTTVYEIIPVDFECSELVADVNLDCRVDAMDLLIILDSWDQTGPGDLNEDGIVDILDMLFLLNNWL